MFNFDKQIDKWVKKKWTEADIQKYVGSFQYTCLTHASDPTLRHYSASGGTTSALLVQSLENGQIDGAIICQTQIIGGKVRAHFGIAKNKEDVIEAQGSKYVETRFLKEVLPLIQDFPGKLAVVGLPCDLTALRRWREKDKALDKKIIFTIGLVCGHNSKTDLIDKVTEKLEKEAGSKIESYKFRFGHWRGQIEARFKNGTVKTPHTKIFNDYQNLFFFCERKCLACHDHYAYDADISAGDVWLYRLKKDPIKKTGLIIRTDVGHKVFNQALKQQSVLSEDIDIRDVMDGQSRIGPSHYNVSARVKTAKFFNIKLKDNVNENIKWHSRLNAFITILNLRLSETKWGKMFIFKVPRPILKLYLYFKKGLETLR